MTQETTGTVDYGASASVCLFDGGFQRPPLHVQRGLLRSQHGHRGLVLRLPRVAFLLQRGHGLSVLFLLRPQHRYRLLVLCLHRRYGFLVAPRPRLALRPHEQQPAGDHQRLQHACHDLPDADSNRISADFQLGFLHGQCRFLYG